MRRTKMSALLYHDTKHVMISMKKSKRSTLRNENEHGFNLGWRFGKLEAGRPDPAQVRKG